MRKRRLWLAALLTATTLSGCDLAPAYHPPAMALPAAYKETGPWQNAEPSDAAPKGAWWQVFQDPALDRLERQAAANNPSIEEAQAAYEKARAFAGEADAGLFPMIGAGGSLSANRQSADRPLRSASQPTYYGANQMDLQASYEVDFWGRVRNGAKAAAERAQAKGEDLQTEKLLIEAELADDYVAVRGLDEEAKLLADTVNTYQQAYQMTQSLMQGQIASGMDVTRAQTQLQNALSQQADIAGRRAMLEHAIAALIGQPPSAVSLPGSTRHLIVPNVPPGVPSALLQRRPDIAAAERRMAAANAGIGVARAAFYPSISIGAGAGMQSTDLNLLEAPNNFWSIGPALAMPLFEGGLRHAALRAAKSELDEETARYKKTVLGAFQEIEDHLAQLHWLEEEDSRERAAADAAQKTLDMSMTLYRNGADSYLDVVTAQTEALNARRAVLALETRQLTATIDLIRAIGGGWTVAKTPQPAKPDVL